ncbi:MAG: cyclic pyranopterin monophosphate synthase MoaC [Gammaproteobacteria bacterium]|nr:cyclic pyranopterin monophosphate synthase MoaC [Gammaproteobacteria bacterium]
MKDVSGKAVTRRIARAQAVIDMPPPVLALLRERRLEKGDALEIARAAGNLAAKRTPELIPLCHPLPLERVEVGYVFAATGVTVVVEVATHARTGVEMEALTAACVAALTLYDMLKPHAGTDLRIRDVLLLEKHGGKSDFVRGG